MAVQAQSLATDLQCKRALEDPHQTTAHHVSESRKGSREIGNPANGTDQELRLPMPPPLKIPRIRGESSSANGDEIRALLRSHDAKLGAGLGEIQNRRHAGLLRLLQDRTEKILAAKDEEIEALRGDQADLEARLDRITAEIRIWISIAKNGEAVVSGLKDSLGRVLGRRAEGSSGCHVADDAESCCFDGDGGDHHHRRTRHHRCRVCGEREVSVLVVPCRHLCLCSECEPAVDTCPVCNGGKNVGLQVFLVAG